MQAVYFNEHGPADRLTYGELPDPIPEADEVLVRVRACGLNHADIWVRRGLPFLRLEFPFVLGQDGHNPDCEPAGVGHVGGDELDVGLLETEQEMRVAAEPVELGDDQRRPIEPARGHRLFEFGPVRPLAAFDFGMFRDHLPVAAVEVIRDGLPLGVEAETGSPEARNFTPW